MTTSTQANSDGHPVEACTTYNLFTEANLTAEYTRLLEFVNQWLQDHPNNVNVPWREIVPKMQEAGYTPTARQYINWFQEYCGVEDGIIHVKANYKKRRTAQEKYGRQAVAPSSIYHALNRGRYDGDSDDRASVSDRDAGSSTSTLGEVNRRDGTPDSETTSTHRTRRPFVGIAPYRPGGTRDLDTAGIPAGSSQYEHPHIPPQDRTPGLAQRSYRAFFRSEERTRASNAMHSLSKRYCDSYEPQEREQRRAKVYAWQSN